MNRLVELYNKISKHSSYQILPTSLSEYVPEKSLQTNSRYEQERLHYLLENMSYENITVADVGGNTGFFTMELLGRGASKIIYIEGNKDHCEFVHEAINVLGLQNKIDIHPQLMNFENDLSLLNVDVSLLMNVLHHVGDDFGGSLPNVNEAKGKILDYLARLAGHTKWLIFQLGFNWTGDTSRPLFDGGSKRELIEYIEHGTREEWSIFKIAVAQVVNGKVKYVDLSDENIHRDDALGEFLNRPLFILRSRLCD